MENLDEVVVFLVLELQAQGERYTKLSKTLLEKLKPWEIKDILEIIFSTLKYQERNSEKLKIFEVADRRDNNPKDFDEALKQMR